MANAIDNLRVLFSYGSSATFPSELKDPNKLYFLWDTQEIYLGGVRYAFGKDITVQVTGTGDVVSSVDWNADEKALYIRLGQAGEAASVQTAIQNALSTCIKHISSDRGSSILVDDSNKDDVKLSLNIAQGHYAGNVTLEECSDGLRGNVELPEVPVQGISADNKINRLEGTNIAAYLTISSETRADGKTYVVLKGFNGVTVSEFDATDFVSAGVLQDVSLVPPATLRMTFIVAGGSFKVVDVDLSDLLNVYDVDPYGGLYLNASNQFGISNSVTANESLNTDKVINFNSVVTLKTISYDGHGMITGTRDITFSIPGLSGNAGVAGSKSKLLTFVSMSDNGVLSGESVDVVTNLVSGATDTQIPTAKAVNAALEDAIEEAATKWQRF